MTISADIYFGSDEGDLNVDRERFVRSLVYGILFRGNLVIPDIMLVGGYKISQLILGDVRGKDFVSASIQTGAIIPAFRSDNGSSFKENVAVLTETNVLPGREAQAREIATVLDRAVGNNHLYYKVWPKEPLSVGYRNVLQRVLGCDALPTSDPDLSALWSQSRDLRGVILNETPEDDRGGYRRADVYRALNKHVGGNWETQLLHPDDICGQISDEKSARVMHRVINWTSHCYFYNQGKMLSLTPGLTDLDTTDVHFTEHLVDGALPQGEAPVRYGEFLLPSAQALLTVDPRYLFDIRRSDIGIDYFSALATWQSKPDDETAGCLIECMAPYTEAIRAAYLTNGKSLFNWQWYLKAHVPCGETQFGRLVNGGLGYVAGEVASNLIPHIGVSTLLGLGATVLFEHLPERARKLLGPAVGLKVNAVVELGKEQKLRSNIGKDYLTDASLR